MWLSHVLKDSFYAESNILFFFLVPTIASNGVFNFMIIVGIIMVH